MEPTAISKKHEHYACLLQLKQKRMIVLAASDNVAETNAAARDFISRKAGSRAERKKLYQQYKVIPVSYTHLTLPTILRV